MGAPDDGEAGLRAMACEARVAARAMATLAPAERSAALRAVRAQLAESRAVVEAANAADKAAAARVNLEAPLLKRLDLEGPKYDAMLAKLDEVAALPDLLDDVSYACKLAEGLELYRVSCPIGVVCVIFESRPEAAVQIAALALKSANALILKGGKEACNTVAALVGAMQSALAALPGGRVPPSAIQLVETREEVGSLLGLHEHIDLVIPRGSNALVASIKASTRIPVMGHADGICHVYVDASADAATAARVVLDSKADYPVACNALESLLLHADALLTAWPAAAAALLDGGVELRLDAHSRAALDGTILAHGGSHEFGFAQLCREASPADYRTEFGALTLAVLTVPDLASAIAHINSHGSHHTDCIVSASAAAIDAFASAVDSAGVYANASTRFADGQRYGFGAEVGVSTNRIHSRGPMGVEGLLIFKYRLYSTIDGGHVAAEHGDGPGRTPFIHRPLPLALPRGASAARPPKPPAGATPAWLPALLGAAAGAGLGLAVGLRSARR